MNGMECCENCRFYLDRNTRTRDGLCRRYPPDELRHRPTNRDRWCGEWQPNAELGSGR